MSELEGQPPALEDGEEEAVEPVDNDNDKQNPDTEEDDDPIDDFPPSSMDDGEDDDGSAAEGYYYDEEDFSAQDEELDFGDYEEPADTPVSSEARK